MKRCRTCGEVKPFDAFHRQSTSRDGHAGTCKQCRLAQEAARRRDAGTPQRATFDDPPGEKTCRRCGTRKPATDFRPAPRNTADGLASYCRACDRQADTERRARQRAARPAPPADTTPSGFKRCARCDEVKPHDRFFRYHRSPDGYQAACKECERVRQGHVPRYIDPAPDGHQTCRTCQQVKALGDFYRELRAPRGVTASCKDCRDAVDAKRRRAKGIPERESFDDPDGFKTCRRCRRQLPVAGFGDEPRNRDGLRSWCERCTLDRTLEWHRANPAAVARLKVIRRGVVDAGGVTERDLARLFTRQAGRCAYCDAPMVPPSLDHVIPVTRGGTHTIGNLVYVCRSCNSSKSDRLLVEWRGRPGLSTARSGRARSGQVQ